MSMRSPSWPGTSRRARPSADAGEKDFHAPPAGVGMLNPKEVPDNLCPSTAQLAGTEVQQSRPLPPPRQGLDPAGRLGHAGAQTSAGTHGRWSGGADGRCRRTLLTRRSKAAAASSRPWAMSEISLQHSRY